MSKYITKSEHIKVSNGHGTFWFETTNNTKMNRIMVFFSDHYNSIFID